MSVKASDAKAVDVLRSARLLRGVGSRVAFSHKRFQEFFRVLGMLDGEEALPSLAPNRIDENRDVLNLLAQICSIETARGLASEAFSNMMKVERGAEARPGQRSYHTMILSLRFLNTAFRNRPNILDPYRSSIRNVVVELWNSFDVLKQKHAVEQLGVVPAETASNLVRVAMYRDIGWLRRVALWQARYISSLQPWLGRCMAAYLSRQSDEASTVGRSTLGTASALSLAARIDRISVGLDVILRVSILVTLVLAMLLDDPLVGTAMAILSVPIYAALRNLNGNSIKDDYFVRNGFNLGFSGFIAFNAIFLAFWNLLGGAISAGKLAFWNEDGPVWLSIAIVVLAAGIWINNYVLRRRDALDELGEVPLLHHSLLKVERPSRDQVAGFLKRNWPFFAFLCVFVFANVAVYWGWLITLIGVCWLGVAVITMSVAASKRIDSALAGRTEKEKIEKFARHFSGLRSEIQDALESVQTDRGRIDILRLADGRANDLTAKLADEGNIWRNGTRPTFNTTVDGYLAMLDERWWGL